MGKMEVQREMGCCLVTQGQRLQRQAGQRLPSVSSQRAGSVPLTWASEPISRKYDDLVTGAAHHEVEVVVCWVVAKQVHICGGKGKQVVLIRWTLGQGLRTLAVKTSFLPCR